MFIADRNIITLRNQQPNAGVFAHYAQRSLGVMSCRLSSDELLHLIRDSASALGINTLKPDQEKAILHVVLGRDVFVALPTGYGKSLCYFVLPLVFDRVRDVSNRSIVLVVSPLVALMKDQVAHCSSRGLAAGYISSDSSDSMKEEILGGKCQVVFISPESLFSGKRWRDMLREKPYINNLVGFVVDEAHCVKKWLV